MMLNIILLLTCVKLLFLKAYRSTDFEVHRNWLAITHSLPLRQWYLDETSPWTLDYPPLFAWFEYVLSQVAYLFDPQMLVVSNLNYASFPTVLFQRLSVIVTDALLACAVQKIALFLSTNSRKKCSKRGLFWTAPFTIMQVLVMANVGLLLVDHIHFQYNGFLTGILLTSVYNLLSKKFYWATFWFSVLINMKHIYLYIAPAFGLYVFKNYCLSTDGNTTSDTKTIVRRTLAIGCIGLSVTTISFGPFIYMGQTTQVIRRLFPFKRGLTHSYWAPNFWALYNFADKVLAYLVSKSGGTVANQVGSMTSGLVQEYEHAVLPNITPLMTFILTIASMVPCLVKLWYNPGNPLHFVRCVVLCGGCCFLFGWHVHEKAVLMIIVPQTILAVLWRREAEFYAFFSTVGHYSLLPLLFTTQEIAIKALLFALFSSYVFTILGHHFPEDQPRDALPLLNGFETKYLSFLPVMFFMENFGAYLGPLFKRYPFLMLMVTSTYCAVGIIYGLAKYYVDFLRMDPQMRKQSLF